MKKRILTAALAAALLAGGLSGCKKPQTNNSVITNDRTELEKIMNLEGLPIAKQPGGITLKVFVGTHPNAINPRDMRWTKQMEEATGVKIEWLWYSETAAGEKVRLMLKSAEDLPDIFMNSINRYEVVEYSRENIFRPVDDLIDEWMPNLRAVFDKRPEYKKAGIAPDGKIYGFPYIEEMNGLGLSPGPIYIYKPWLDKLGLPLPQTLDDFRAYLEKIRDNDMNDNGKDDEIPFTFQVGGWDSYEGYHQIISCFGINDMYNHLTVQDGKVVNTTTLPQFKLGIDYVNRMYRDKLIDEDAFMPALSGDPRSRIIGKLNDKTVTIGAVQLFDLMGEISSSEQRRGEYVALPRLTGPNGGKQGIRYNDSEMKSVTRCVITSKCQYPEAAARWIDYCYDPEQSVYLNWGTEDYVYKKDAQGVLRWDVDADGKPNLKEGYESMAEMRWASTPVSGALAILTDYYDSVVEYPLDAQLIIKGQKEAGLEAVLSEREYLPPLWMTSEEIEKLAQMETYVNNLVNASVTKWLMEGGVNEDWDSYQQSLKTARIDEVMAVYQAAYDRYKANMG